MWWFLRTRKSRAEELDGIAQIMWNRRSKNYHNRLEVRLLDPNDKRSPFVILCKGKQISGLMITNRQVEKFIEGYYDNLLYNGNDAPNDIFLDSMNAVTKKKC
jgi:hypothetical protein